MKEAEVFTPVGGPKNKNRSVVRKVNQFALNNKENFNVHEGSPGRAQKSPLPLGYPRMPLHDITAILQASSETSEDGTLQLRKPFTSSRRGKGCAPICTAGEVSLKGSVGAGPKQPRSKHALQEFWTKHWEAKDAIHLTIDLQIREGSKDPSESLDSDECTKLAQPGLASGSGETRRSNSSMVEVSVESLNADSVEGSLTKSVVGDKDDNLGSRWDCPNNRGKNLDITLSRAEPQATCPVTNSEETSLKKSKIAHKKEGVECQESMSSSRTSYQYGQDQKRQKALSCRSKVAKFR